MKVPDVAVSGMANTTSITVKIDGHPAQCCCRFIRTICPLILILILLTGCATKGGWPCWSWQSNTDQKLRSYYQTHTYTNGVWQANPR